MGYGLTGSRFGVRCSAVFSPLIYFSVHARLVLSSLLFQSLFFSFLM